MEATFVNAVVDTGAAIEVTKDGNPVPATVTWDEATRKVATITTTANMIKGTYTVTVTTKNPEATASKTVDIVDQYAKEIVVKADTALTDAENPAIAYVYYDVIDQYGNSVRDTYSVQWNVSCGNKDVDTATGRITLYKTKDKTQDDETFTYGDSVYLTGVIAKSATTLTKVVKIGAKRQLDSVEMVGFVRKGTSTLVSSLPKNFKAGQYFLLYAAFDQEKNPLEAQQISDGYLGGNKKGLSMISSNVLLVKNEFEDATPVTIGDTTYNAATVVPGQWVDQGGDFTVTALATNTGTKTEKNFTVGADQILTSFSMVAPSNAIECEKVEVKFSAKDQNGQEITNYRSLARSMNALNLTVSDDDDTLELAEKNDGTAALYFYPKGGSISQTAWETDSELADGIDRTASLTAVVVGGTSDTVVFSVKDAARPKAISNVNSWVMNSVLLPGTTSTMSDVNAFTFIDQYGRTMRADNAEYFFKASGNYKGNDLNGYYFGIKATHTESQSMANDNKVATDNDQYFYYKNGNPVTTASASAIEFTAGNVTNDNEAVSFYIIANNEKPENLAYDKWVSISKKTQNFSVVSPKQLKNFAITDVDTLYVETEVSGKQSLADYNANDYSKGDFAAATLGAITNDAETKNVKAGNKKFKVTGTYNGVSTEVPVSYVKVTGNLFVTSPDDDFKTEITDVSCAAINVSDLYNVSDARGTRKADPAKKKLVVQIVSGDSIISTASKEISISDAAPKITKIEAFDTAVLCGTYTVVTYSGIAEDATYESVEADIDARANKLNKYTDGAGKWYQTVRVFDQYGNAITDATFEYTVTDVTENADAYADNSFSTSDNASNDAVSEGIELGDKFKLTISAGNSSQATGSISKDITITVGSDCAAWISDAGNTFDKALVEVLKGFITK